MNRSHTDCLIQRTSTFPPQKLALHERLIESIMSIQWHVGYGNLTRGVNIFLRVRFPYPKWINSGRIIFLSFSKNI